MNCSNHNSLYKSLPIEESYLVCEYGCVYSLRTKKQLKPSVNKDGYLRYWLVLKGKKMQIFEHRLVAFTFITVPRKLDRMIKQDSIVINHKDNNKINNHYSNLEWVSNRKNLDIGLKEHYQKYGQQTSRNKGSSNPNAKLKDSDVANILHMKGSVTSSAIKSMYQLSSTTLVYLIWNRKSWRHVN